MIVSNTWKICNTTYLSQVSEVREAKTHPIKLDMRIAELSIHPSALHTSKYLVVNIRSIVILVANKT